LAVTQARDASVNRVCSGGNLCPNLASDL